MPHARTATVVTGPRSAIYAFHHLAGVPSPTNSPHTSNVVEAARRQLAAPVCKKEPLAAADVQRLCARFAGQGCSLEDLMVCAMVSVAFTGFFRFSDCRIVHMQWLEFRSGFIWVFLEKRKTDQYREGNWVPIAEWDDSVAFPVRLVRRLMARVRVQQGAPGAAPRPLFSATASDGRYGSAPLEYDATLKSLRSRLAAIGLDPEKYATHSLRSGGATATANAGLPDRLWMQHGGWRSIKSVYGYIKTDVDVRLEVSRAVYATADAPPAASAPPRPELPTRPRVSAAAAAGGAPAAPAAPVLQAEPPASPVLAVIVASPPPRAPVPAPRRRGRPRRDAMAPPAGAAAAPAPAPTTRSGRAPRAPCRSDL
jgi:hypothetical protein